MHKFDVLSSLMMTDVRKLFSERKTPQYYNLSPKRFVLVSLTWSFSFLACYYVVNFHHIVRNRVRYFKQSTYKHSLYIDKNDNRSMDSYFSNSNQDICLFNKAYYDQLKIRYLNIKKNCTTLNREVSNLILITILQFHNERLSLISI